jgi:hypothetical protein
MGGKSTKVIQLQDDTQYPLGSPVLDIKTKCNYDCPVCQKTGKTPNMAGRFFLINDTECKCNACETVFPKEKFYKNVSGE